MPGRTEWLVFLGTAAIFALTPGPGILYVLARSLRGGRGEGIRSATGNAIGAAVHVTAAAFGLSALLATSKVAFEVVKIAGAVYLVFLGVQAIRHRRDEGGDALGPASPGSAVEGGRSRRTTRWARLPLAQGVLTELLNPKTALYFVALLPHFVHPERAPAPLVFVVLGLVALAMALVVDLAVAIGAGRIGHVLMRSPRLRIRQRVASGATMIGLGAFVAASDT